MTTGARAAGESGAQYSHTQTGWWMMGIMGTVALLVVAPLLVLLPGRADSRVGAIIGGTVLLVLLLTMALFSTLNVRVTGDAVVWRFGPGLIGGRVPLQDIAGVAPARTPLLAGIGIHWIGRGWVYNVSGRDSVAITRRNGSITWLGTDEPQALAEAIERARGR